MLFDSTVRRELVRSFGVTLVVILTIVLTSMLISTLRQAAGGNVAPQDVLLLMGYASLAYLPTMLALSLFIAIVASLGRMYRESEMTIWFASGVPLRRFVRPVLRMSAPILVLVLVLELIVWPWSNQNSAQLKERYERRGDLSRVAPGQFQSSRDGSRVFFIERDSADGTTGRNVFILANTARTEAVTTSAKGHVEIHGDDRFLVLDKGQRNEQNHESRETSLSRFERYEVLADSQVLASASKLPPKAMSTVDLLKSTDARQQGELAWRFGMILGAVNMVLLALPLAHTNPRRPNSWNLMFALLSFVIYFNMINLTQSWVGNGRMPLPKALVLVHGTAFVLALVMVVWRDNRIRFGRRGTPAAATAGASA